MKKRVYPTLKTKIKLKKIRFFYISSELLPGKNPSKFIKNLEIGDELLIEVPCHFYSKTLYKDNHRDFVIECCPVVIRNLSKECEIMNCFLSNIGAEFWRFIEDFEEL